MKNKILFSVLLVIAITTMGSSASALNLSYEYSGVTYGTMDITAFDFNTLKIGYTANSPLPGTAQVTGFAFSFIPDATIPGTVWDPLDAVFGNDEDDLDWVASTNLNAIPNPANSSLSKDDFYFAATSGGANNFTPPGISAGEYDTFYLDFTDVADLTLIDLSNFVQYTGIRLQSLPNDINGGSLFLADSTTPVPEPATMLLLGTGLVGPAGFGRKKYKK